MMASRFKSIASAERRVRILEKQIADWLQIGEKMAHDMSLLARLSAKGPAFDNPLVAFEAEKVRDELLRRMNMGPDGKWLPQEDGA